MKKSFVKFHILQNITLIFHRKYMEAHCTEKRKYFLISGLCSGAASKRKNVQTAKHVNRLTDKQLEVQEKSKLVEQEASVSITHIAM